MEKVARKSCRTQITKLLKSAKEKLSEGEEISELMVVSDRIITSNASLRRANENLAPHVAAEEMDEECDKVLEYEDQVAEVLSRIRIRIDQADQRKNCDEDQYSQNTPHNQNVQGSHSSGEGISGRSNVKLPKLELRKFKGELSEWTLFWEQFRTAVHENQSLDAVAKFNYLQQSLIGKAAVTISGLTPSQQSYEYAIELLKHEYGNQQRIIDNHVQRLLSLTPIKSRVHSVGLRTLYNTTSSITRNLTALGVDAKEYGMMAKSIMLNCMPYAMKVEFYKKNPTDNENGNTVQQIDVLLKFLKLEVESIEIAQTPSSNVANVPTKEENRFRGERYKTISDTRKGYTAAGLLTAVN